MSNCPFCPANWPNLDIVERWMPGGPAGSVAIVRPLNPVTAGHVLVIHRDHDGSAAESRDASRRACLLMGVAADYVNVKGLQANIITSVGPDATQTVFHTHLHVVPRLPGDGLALPWTDQASIPRLEEAVRAAFRASDDPEFDEDNAVHYRGKACGLQTAIDIVKGNTR